MTNDEARMTKVGESSLLCRLALAQARAGAANQGTGIGRHASFNRSPAASWQTTEREKTPESTVKTQRLTASQRRAELSLRRSHANHRHDIWHLAWSCILP